MELEIFERETTPDKIWKQQMKRILARPEDICQKLVKSTYIRKDALAVSNFLVVGYVRGREFRGTVSRLIGGFLIANEAEFPGFLYIDVICSDQEGVGGKMMEAATARAKARGLQGIILSSLPHVVGYYRSLGFRNRDNCVEENPKLGAAFVTLVKPLIDEYKGNRKTLNQNVAAHVYNSRDKKGNDYRKFLNELRKSHLAKNKQCRTVAHCNQDGYLMSKCFQELPGAPQPSPRRSRGASPATKPKTPPATKPKTPPATTPTRAASPRRTRSKSPAATRTRAKSPTRAAATKNPTPRAASPRRTRAKSPAATQTRAKSPAATRTRGRSTTRRRSKSPTPKAESPGSPRKVALPGWLKDYYYGGGRR